MDTKHTPPIVSRLRHLENQGEEYISRPAKTAADIIVDLLEAVEFILADENSQIDAEAEIIIRAAIKQAKG